MIDYKNLRKFYNSYIANKEINERGNIWRQLLEITPDVQHVEIIKRAVLSCCCNFNYWEENGKIEWPRGMNGQTWFDVIMGRRDVNTMNLSALRKYFWRATENWLQDNTFAISDPSWWTDLTKVFGNDPLRKREVLLYIILTDLGYKNIPCPNVGCIDYNVITAFRYHGVVDGYVGNHFTEEEETRLRFECLCACYELLHLSKDLNVSKLDNLLYTEGRRIRHQEEDWSEYFCYRIGCYYY